MVYAFDVTGHCLVNELYAWFCFMTANPFCFILMQSIEPLANSTPQAPQQTASKESKNTVDHNANSSPVNETNGDDKPKRTTRGKVMHGARHTCA